MRGKAKGTRNEYKSRRILEAAGYYVVRSAGSHGIFDLIGIGTTDLVLCQVKTTCWPSLLELEQIREFQAPENARKLVHRWRDRMSMPDVREID